MQIKHFVNGEWVEIRQNKLAEAFEHAAAHGSEFAKDLYKIATNNQGHIISASPVTKSDLTEYGLLDSDSVASNYNENDSYTAGEFVIYDGKLYKALENCGPESFNPSKWEAANILIAAGSGGTVVSGEADWNAQEGEPGYIKNKPTSPSGGAVDSVNGKTGVVVLNAEDVGALSNDVSIPTKTSDLIDDSNFISDANYVHTDNNYTNADKTKLAGIEAGATVDDKTWNGVTLSTSATYTSADQYIPVKSTNQLNGAAFQNILTETPTAYGVAKYDNNAHLKSTTPANNDNSTKVATTAFVNNAISSLGSILNYKGTKPTVGDLPQTGNTAGDIWIVESDGLQYIWNGTSWDNFSSTVDLSGYVQTSRTINGKALSENISLNASDVGALSDAVVVPSKTSDLTNDSGFITQSDVPLEIFWVNVNTTSERSGEDIVTTDKTVNEIIAAKENGKLPIVLINGWKVLTLIHYDSSENYVNVVFNSIQSFTSYTLSGQFSDGTESWDYSELFLVQRNSPRLAGTPTAPTPTTTSGATQIATKEYVDTAVESVTVLPSQSGQSGKFLTTNGTTASWVDNPPEIFWINITTNDYITATADKTYAEIIAAINAGKYPVISSPDLIDPLNDTNVLYPFDCVSSGDPYTIDISFIRFSTRGFDYFYGSETNRYYCENPKVSSILFYSDNVIEIVPTIQLATHSELASYMQKGVDYVTAGQKDGTTLGNKATAEGYYTTASGNYSHAEGNRTGAIGQSSHAEGNNTIANHKSQHVFGEYNIADTNAASSSSRGDYVEIVGNGTSTSALSNARTLDWSGNEVLAGKLTVGAGPTNNMDVTTKQYVDTAVGSVDALPSQTGNSGKFLKTNGTSASWSDTPMIKGTDYVTAGNLHGYAIGTSATVEGAFNKSSGNYSHSEGSNVKAEGDYSHAEGKSTTASGYAAHAEGLSTTASAQNSHAEGQSTTASGIGAHAEGQSTTASGVNSHTEGGATIANHKYQHVFGQFNVADTNVAAATAIGDYVEIVGNGTADNARSNARTLDWSGNETLAGKLTVGAAPVNDMDVATKVYVDTIANSISSLIPLVINVKNNINTKVSDIEAAIADGRAILAVKNGMTYTLHHGSSEVGEHWEFCCGQETYAPLVQENENDGLLYLVEVEEIS